VVTVLYIYTYKMWNFEAVIIQLFKVREHYFETIGVVKRIILK
jgi:hypothetical protein